MRKTIYSKFRRPSPAWGALLVLSSVAFAAMPCSAAAGEKPNASRAAQVDRLNEQGASHYARREYRQAIDLFSKALAIDPDPNLLFNIARCHERLGEIQAAIDNYELFLSTPGADAQGRSRAQEALTALRKTQAPTTAPSPTDSAAAPASPMTTTAEPQDSSLVPWLTLGGGASLLALGAAVYFVGVADHRKVTRANDFGRQNGVVDMTLGEAQELVDAGDLKKMLGGIGLGVGGALIATYVIMLTTDSSSVEPADTAFSILPSSTGAALSFQGSF